MRKAVNLYYNKMWTKELAEKIKKIELNQAVCFVISGLIMYIALLLAFGVVAALLFKDKAGIYGDMFGGFNAAASGLAVIGVLVTLFIQIIETGKLREETELLRSEHRLNLTVSLLDREVENVIALFPRQINDYPLKAATAKGTKKLIQKLSDWDDPEKGNLLDRLKKIEKMKQYLEDLRDDLDGF